jgi:hypothetical protein
MVEDRTLNLDWLRTLKLRLACLFHRSCHTHITIFLYSNIGRYGCAEALMLSWEPTPYTRLRRFPDIRGSTF